MQADKFTLVTSENWVKKVISQCFSVSFSETKVLQQLQDKTVFVIVIFAAEIDIS